MQSQWKSQHAFYSPQIDKLNSKMYMQCKKPRIAKTTFENMNKVGGFIILYFKTNNKTVVINTG